ncbi:MAG: aminotransferase class III-fold pyridoxal phosphate-dependent enzyme, partial [Candidatus Binatia bacterium]
MGGSARGEGSPGTFGNDDPVRRLADAVTESAGGGFLLSRDEYDAAVAEVGALRGRPLFLPYLSSGFGRGARVQLADGRWVIDFALGIGVHFFGHGDPDLRRVAVDAARADTAMQGNLQMGLELPALLRLLVKNAGGRIAHGWIANSGAEANEIALKIIRQRKQPAAEIIAFRGGFHGRTTTMAEITDRPEYRRGQPSREVVHYLPFYDRRDPASADRARNDLREILRSRPGRIAGFVLELVQGETGFRTAPREFFLPLLEECRRAGVATWVDEVQTFGRTGELFAFRKLDLADLVDVVTVGKLLHCAATLFVPDLRPDPGLVSGTFAGSTVGLALG